MEKKTGPQKRKKFLDKMRAELLEMKNRHLVEMNSELRAGREAGKDEGMDTYDLASEERDREINFILSARDHLKIKQIDDALERIQEGDYGICDSCGMEIAEERLRTLPFTRLCRDCQQEQEREAKARRRYDEGPTVYRRLGPSDNDDEET